MASIYKGPGHGVTSTDIGPIDAEGHEDHDHEVTVIPGDQLPDEVKEALIKALAQGMLPEGVSITERQPEDPNPVTDEEWKQLRVALTGTAYMLLQGVQHIEASMDPGDPHRKMTREEAVDGLKRASEVLMERYQALTGGQPEQAAEEEGELPEALQKILQAIQEDKE